jgi:hypothetical protein
VVDGMTGDCSAQVARFGATWKALLVRDTQAVGGWFGSFPTPRAALAEIERRADHTADIATPTA